MPKHETRPVIRRKVRRQLPRRLQARASGRSAPKSSAPLPYAGALLLLTTLAVISVGIWLWQREQTRKNTPEARLRSLIEATPQAAVFQEKAVARKKTESPPKKSEVFQSEENYDPDAAVRARRKNAP